MSDLMQGGPVKIGCAAKVKALIVGPSNNEALPNVLTGSQLLNFPLGTGLKAVVVAIKIYQDPEKGRDLVETCKKSLLPEFIDGAMNRAQTPLK